MIKHGQNLTAMREQIYTQCAKTMFHTMNTIFYK